MSPDKAAALFDRLSKTPREMHDAEWLHFMGEVLKLPTCYLPAAQEILRQGAWRRRTGRGQNPIGYVKTATEREGLRMGLATHRHDRTEPRVLTKDQPQKRKLVIQTEDLRFDRLDKRRGRVPLAVPVGVTYSDHIDQLQGVGSNGMPTKTSRGTWHQGGREQADDYDNRRIPVWLQRDGECDAVDWDTVAKHAVLKPRMAPAIAKVLKLRASGWSQPRALANAPNRQEADRIEAAWKWVDRCFGSRIAPLFKLEVPPPIADTSHSCPTPKNKFLTPAQALDGLRAKGLNAKAVDERDLLLTGPSISVTPTGGLSRGSVQVLGWDGTHVSLVQIGSWEKLRIPASSIAEVHDIVNARIR